MPVCPYLTQVSQFSYLYQMRPTCWLSCVAQNLWFRSGSGLNQVCSSLSRPVNRSDPESPHAVLASLWRGGSRHHHTCNNQVVRGQCEDYVCSLPESPSLGRTEEVKEGFSLPRDPGDELSETGSHFRATYLQKEVKMVDAELARVQVLMHNPVAPFIWLLHTCNDVEVSISINDAKEAIIWSLSSSWGMCLWACPNSDGRGY